MLDRVADMLRAYGPTPAGMHRSPLTGALQDRGPSDPLPDLFARPGEDSGRVRGPRHV